MKPINFPEQNKVLEKPEGWTDEQCQPLPVRSDEMCCVSCWQLNFRERLSVLFFGKIWVEVWNGPTQPPIGLYAVRKFFRMQYYWLGAPGGPIKLTLWDRVKIWWRYKDDGGVNA